MTRATGPVAAKAPSEEARVALRIADFLVRTERERLTLFRGHLHATVTRISPLLVELAIMEGIQLKEAVALMYPPQDWPWRPLYDHPPGLIRRTQRQAKGLAGTYGPNEIARFRRAFANPGLVIREIDHPRGRFAIRPCGGMLGFTAAIGPCILSAFGTSAMLRLPGPLPETLAMSLPGRQLDQLVDHPLFRGRGYRIRRVIVDEADDAPSLMLRVPLISFAMPFPEDGS